MSQVPRVSIIIPAYNEEDGLKATLPRLKELSKDNNWEVIVVDDGSTDNTFQVASGFGFIKILRHPLNKGNGSTLKAGIRLSTSEILIFMDADGQHDPNDIPEFLEEIGCYDMVVGARTKCLQDGWLRKPGKWLLGRIANYLSGMKIPDVNCGFRAVKKKCFEEFITLYPNGFSLPTTLTMAMIKAGHSIKYIPIATSPRIGRKSTVRVGSDGIKALLLMLRCVMLFDPLKVSLPISAFLFTCGSTFALYSFSRYHNVANSAIIITLSGLFIFLFGLILDRLTTVKDSRQ